MKKVIILFLFASTLIFAQQKILTLQESLDLGLKNSKELKIAKAKLIIAEAKMTESTSYLLPQLKFSASYMHLSNVPPFTIPEIPHLIPAPITMSPTILNNYNLKLSLQQPLFTGFRLWSLKDASSENYKAEESIYKSSINDAALNIETAFWNFYKAKQLKSVLDENLKQIKKHLDDTKNFLKNGLATQNDVLKLEVEYSNIQLKIIDTKNNIDLARLNFNRILSLPIQENTDIEITKMDTTFTKYNIDYILKEAEDNRNDLKSLKYRVKASDNAVTAANGSWYPSVFLVGDYYYSKPNQRYFPAVNEFKNTWDVGVTLQWDIWNWGLTSSQVTEAEQTRIQAKTAYEQLKDALQVEVYHEYLNYNRTLDKVRVSQQSVGQAEENYRIIQDKYDQQIATSTDLIDAEVSVRQAKTNLTNSLVDYQLAKAQLEKAIGKKLY
jgi:outer membrane protein